MIYNETKSKYWWVWSDSDVGKFGPFESVWIKGEIKGEGLDEKMFDGLKLKTWKDVLGWYKGSLYRLQEENGRMLLKSLDI